MKNNNNETPTLIDLVGLTEFYSKLKNNVVVVSQEIDLYKLMTQKGGTGIFIGKRYKVTATDFTSTPHVIVSFSNSDAPVDIIFDGTEGWYGGHYNFIGIFIKIDIKFDYDRYWSSNYE